MKQKPERTRESSEDIYRKKLLGKCYRIDSRVIWIGIAEGICEKNCKRRSG